MITRLVFSLLLLSCLSGCSGTPQKDHAASKKSSEKCQGHCHGHTAQYGGTLVSIGDHFAHLEFVLDPASGKLTAYVLDGEAEKPIRLKQEAIDLTVKIEGVTTALKLMAVASELSGEQIGDSAQFEGQSEHLKGVKAFDAMVGSLEIKGQQLSELSFKFPDGNEEKSNHGHSHD